MKTCTKCGIEKPVSAFNKDQRYKDGLLSWCKDCRREHARNRRETFEQERDKACVAKRCSTCGKTKPASEFTKRRGSKDGLQSWCKKCRTKKDAERSAKKTADGICVYCSEEKLEHSIKCLKCWANAAARLANRRCQGKVTGVEVLRLLERQGYRCPRTGRQLVPGLNASLDHIMSISQGGTNAIENLEMVDLNYNRAKNVMSHQDLLQLCRDILSQEG